MATNKKPRKAYRPKGVARPLRHDQRRDLELAARVHANKLYCGSLDEQGWNTLAAHLNLCAVMAGDDRFRPAIEAMESIRARHGRTDVYGATGDERAVILDQFNEAVQYLGSRTDKQVSEGLLETYRRCGL